MYNPLYSQWNHQLQLMAMAITEGITNNGECANKPMVSWLVNGPGVFPRRRRDLGIRKKNRVVAAL